jgi:hypothetical protein
MEPLLCTKSLKKGSVLKGLKNPASTFTILAIIKLFSVNVVFFFQN